MAKIWANCVRLFSHTSFNDIFKTTYFTNSTCLSCLKQLFALVKIVQLSPLTDEKMKRNEENREEKIRLPDSYKSQLNLK